ncbi:hypothetical protein JMJ77_0001072, partial [Colletotrichum scovillei]
RLQHETSIWQVESLGILHSLVSRSPEGYLLTVQQNRNLPCQSERGEGFCGVSGRSG